MQRNGLNLLLIPVIAVVLLVFWIFGIYNKLQTMDEQVNSNWAQVENQLKRRNDLIPNLVSTVKGYAKYEEGVYTQIADARSKLAGSINKGDVKEVQKNNAELDGALSRLLAIAENYPNLKADKSFIGLQDELTGTENRIAVARRDYNESIKTLNTTIRTLPASVIAPYIGIQKRDYFEVEESEKALPKVEF